MPFKLKTLKLLLAFGKIIVHSYYLLAISNTISEEKTETKTIFERGVSNKGRERGIGLANVTEILDNYINVNLETQSNNFSFTQQLTITKKA
ncbi:GHKL domain-containing protein [Streptococcus thermophilus]|uniref:GHKL domain-containing protein n=1 Tax=Streptococcus thermophilus TaxID=1308 RepID=UPI0035588BEF